LVQNNVRIVYSHVKTYVQIGNISKQRDWNSMERFVERIKEQALAVLIKKRIVIFWHVPKKL